QPTSAVGDGQYVDDGTHAVAGGVGTKTQTSPGLLGQLKAQVTVEHFHGALHLLLGQGDRADASDGVFRGHRSPVPAVAVVVIGTGSQLAESPVGVTQAQHTFLPPSRGRGGASGPGGQVLCPPAQGGLGDGTSRGGDLSGTDTPTGGVRPGEEGHDRAGVSRTVAVVEVVDVRGVEVDGAFDQAHAQCVEIELGVGPGVARDRGHVVDPTGTYVHVVTLFLGVTAAAHHGS